MHRRAEAREDAGDLVIGDPSGVFDPGGLDRAPCRFRIADAVDARPETQGGGRLQQVCLQLRRALVVAPVADPDEIAFVRFTLDRPEQRSDEHTSALQSLMRISYAVFCL